MKFRGTDPKVHGKGGHETAAACVRPGSTSLAQVHTRQHVAQIRPIHGIRGMPGIEA